jgi:polyferredoxin
MKHAGRYCNRCGTRLAHDNTGMRCGACIRAGRDTLLRPPLVPPEFWDTDQMRDALATWHMGRVIYAYRNHPYHGRPLSQEVVGGWLGLTQTQVSRIENGRAPEELTKLVCWAQILGIPGKLLWFALPEQPSSGLQAEADQSQTLTLSA